MRKSGSQSQEREVQPLHGRSALLACFFFFFFPQHTFLLTFSVKHCESGQQAGNLAGETSSGLGCGHCPLSDVSFPVGASAVALWLPRRPGIIRKRERLS